ncbi:hypothetical protein TruAng_011391 [Truncatella angustata]|nr:hypothetical protein TruAng_011391 [Truncatella angustata]
MEGNLPLASLPTLLLHDGLKREQINPVQIISDWLARLEACFQVKAFGHLSDLFIDDCWWRDIVGLSWDWTTKHGQEAISTYLSASPNPLRDIQCAKTGGLQPTCMDAGDLFWIQGGFLFKHPYGEGKGFVRLTNEGNGEWKAWTVFTQLFELDFQKEVDAKKTLRTPATNGISKPAEENLALQVLVVGAGQAGLALGAHLKNMGINSLLVDKATRVGDSWRNRYTSVALHTPRYTDYYPFLKTPESWPRYIPQDKIASFMEHYSQLMELDIMLQSTVTKVEYNEDSRTYHVEAQTPSGLQVFTPRHVVLATGLFSEKPIIPEFSGRELFQGQLYHSKAHRSASHIPDLHSKKVVIIGAGSSAHDLAHDFVSHGAQNITMIQRGAIVSISEKSQELFLFSLWDTDGISTEEADVIGNSFPTPVVRTMSVGLTQMMCTHDKEMIDGLKRAGLAVRTGEDGISIAEHQLVRGGQFYIDQGANEMIIDGRIKIRRSEGGVKEFNATGLILADGTNINADVVVLATGFHRSIVDIRDIMGEEVADKVGTIGFLDGEQERKGTWRPTGTPGFWYMTGSFIWCRQYSLVLALQIAAIEHGLNEAHYEQNKK